VEIIVIPANVDLSYEVFFQDPLFELIEKSGQIKLLKHLMKTFGLSLNDIKINNQSPSNNFYHFSKMFGKSFFDVSFGLQEIRASLGNPESREQIINFYHGLNDSFREFPLSMQRFNVQQHLLVEGDAKEYLGSLNPSSPDAFQKLLGSSWVGYNLQVQEHQLSINVVVALSLFVTGGVFFSTQFEFKPAISDFKRSFDLVDEYQTFVQKGLGLVQKGA